MPTYEYACRSCAEHIEVVQSFTDDPLEECGLCGGTLRKVFSPAGIIFKGSGYYVTDTRASEGSSLAASDGAKQPAGGSSDGAAKDSASGSSDGGAKDSAGSSSAGSSDSGSSDSGSSGSGSGSGSDSADSGGSAKKKSA